MAETTNARERGRRITLEIPEPLYARLLITKVQTRRSLSALAEQALAEFADRLSAERRAARASGGDAAKPNVPE